jgi:long-subunit fatty acid transport protein
VFTSADSAYRSSYLDFASLAVPVTLWGKPVTFQGSWRRLYSLDYRENLTTQRVPVVPDGPPQARFDGNGETVGALDFVSAAVAVSLTRRLSLGAGVNFWRGDWDEAGIVSETVLEPPGAPVFATESTTNRVRGENFTLGLMLAYTRWSVGMVYQGPLRSDFDGTLRAASSESAEVTNAAASGTLQFPRAFGLGAAFRPARLWTVAVDLTWDDWTNAILDTPIAGRVNLFDGLPLELTSTRDTVSLNAGAERLFTGEGFIVPLRFGVAWEPQGPRDPYTRDAVNFVLLALGTGYNTNSLKFDAAFQYRWAGFSTGATFEPGEASALAPAAVGERSNSQWRLKLSLILRVTDTDKLKRVARKVFG